MRLGVFGGSFDPVHNGHLFVAEAVREICALDRVLFVPTREGKHYRNGAMSASPEHRAAMLRLAVASNPAFAIDESDLAPDASGYTADLLPKLKARHPGAALAFIVGGDSLTRSRWQRLDDVLDVVEQLVVAPRGGVSATEIETALAELATDRRAKIRMVELPLVEESATLIRERLKARKTVRYLIPEPVHRYIEDHGLYGT